MYREMAGGAVDPVKVTDASVQEVGSFKIKGSTRSYTLFCLWQRRIRRFTRLGLAKRFVIRFRNVSAVRKGISVNYLQNV